MEVIECHLCGKSGERKITGDGILINPGYIAVVDGQTPRNGSNRLAGYDRYAALVLLNELDEGVAYNASCEEAMTRLHKRLKKECAKHRVKGKDLAASIAIYSITRREIWVTGDIGVMIDGVAYRHDKRRLEEIAAEARAGYTLLKQRNGMSEEEIRETDPGHKYILPLLDNHTYMNGPVDSPYRYTAINGESINVETDVHVQTVPPDSVEVVFASDGYPALLSSLERSEAYLKRVLKEDPLCIGINKGIRGIAPGDVSYGDRAYIRFTT